MDRKKVLSSINSFIMKNNVRLYGSFSNDLFHLHKYNDEFVSFSDIDLIANFCTKSDRLIIKNKLEYHINTKLGLDIKVSCREQSIHSSIYDHDQITCIAFFELIYKLLSYSGNHQNEYILYQINKFILRVSEPSCYFGYSESKTFDLSNFTEETFLEAINMKKGVSFLNKENIEKYIFHVKDIKIQNVLSELITSKNPEVDIRKIDYTSLHSHILNIKNLPFSIKEDLSIKLGRLISV